MARCERRLLWTALLLVLLLHALVPRYELRVDGGALLRWDRWKGRLEIVSAAAIADSSWATAILPATHQPNVARPEDILSIEPPPAK